MPASRPRGLDRGRRRWYHGAVKHQTPSERFDEDYFRRHYEDRRTRVTTPEKTSELVRAVVGLARYWDVPLDTALDLGAGVGHWKRALARHAPKLAYRGVDVSPYACAKYGHEQADISRFVVPQRFDLVICQGVLQYLDDDAAARALKHICAMTHGLLYLEALTKRDVEEVVDLGRTDTAVHVRPGTFYRRALARHFVTVGAGLFAATHSGPLLFELEQA